MIQAAKIIGTGLATIRLIGAGVRIGAVFVALILSVALNPSLREQLFSYAILGFAFSEATWLTVVGTGIGVAFILSMLITFKAYDGNLSILEYIKLCSIIFFALLTAVFIVFLFTHIFMSENMYLCVDNLSEEDRQAFHNKQIVVRRKVEFWEAQVADSEE